MKTSEITIIGAAILDVLVSPADPGVFQSGSSPADRISMSFGGDALNEAMVLSHLGKGVQLQTVLGDDMQGEMIRRKCEELGISLPESCVRDALRTGINVVLVQPGGERCFLTDRGGSLRRLTMEDLELQFPRSTKVVSFASIFVFPELGSHQLAEIFSAAKQQGKIVCADMTKRKNQERPEDMAEALRYVDYLLPNEEEACLFTGCAGAEEAAEALLAAGVGTVVMKLGSRGCLVASKKETYRIPAVPDVKCVDTTGAGDSFAAGFLFGLSEDWEVRRCAEFANACGAGAVTQLGAAAWCEPGMDKITGKAGELFRKYMGVSQNN